MSSGVTASCGELWSDRCGLAGLCTQWVGFDRARGSLVLADGWTGRWRAQWRASGAPVLCAVRDLASMPISRCEPVRRFSWRRGQRHRPGLQFMVSTGRHHGFESIAEQRLLLALDFAGGVSDVLGQPFRLRFATGSGWREHIPDFLAVTAEGGLLIDVRPGERIGDDDRVCFAAAREAALAAGWSYLVVTGWRPHVQTGLDTLSAQRRPLRDPLGLQSELFTAVASGPRAFGDLVAATRLPAVARAHALHLIWHRRLGIDLSAPLNDAAKVWASLAGVGR
ncbi:TnsA-like heteromeric transposase endonuclease subunit [Paractinoplanes rishiriensis]|uniref:TnsA-like heteromeric transposase endonuclease subunit n=1 Tax=Paractinoplanes rishiriensis TaxID=1050105 RepID=A0A919JRP5_9ACTN|nr:TnsA-like heteromeric transposase endonuclease subunit [Actinoplanes rishiriensis]GIE93916.1 hypothetical protein Ari01nite_13810 [Actinoplanes rishiriensis]